MWTILILKPKILIKTLKIYILIKMLILIGQKDVKLLTVFILHFFGVRLVRFCWEAITV
jgi:hypothetical protein